LLKQRIAPRKPILAEMELDPMDNRTDSNGAFAIRLAADLLTALVLKGVLTRDEARALVRDGRDSLLPMYPKEEARLREIAATITVQLEVVT
jgi:hypothetical protein